MPLDDPAQGARQNSQARPFPSGPCGNMCSCKGTTGQRFRASTTSGHTREECAERFGFSNGAWHHAVTRGRLVLREEPRRRPRRVTREAVRRLRSSGMTQAQIATELNICRSTVCFHMRNLGVEPAPEPARRYDWEQIRGHYEAGHSFRECQEAFGFSRDAWADAVGRGAIVPRARLEPIEQILAAGRRRHRGHVKGRPTCCSRSSRRRAARSAESPSGVRGPSRWSFITSTGTAWTTVW